MAKAILFRSQLAIRREGLSKTSKEVKKPFGLNYIKHGKSISLHGSRTGSHASLLDTKQKVLAMATFMFISVLIFLYWRD